MSNKQQINIDRLADLQKILSYDFRDLALLHMALVHASTLAAENNERLEFLGDRVLALVLTQYLYATHPLDKEGVLSQRLNNLVQKKSIALVARYVRLEDYLASTAVPSESMLADAMEAVIGAIFLDGGYMAARDVVVNLWQQATFKEDLGQDQPAQDAKTALQEWAQGQGLPLPEYTLVKRSGSDHAPEFVVRVSVQGFGEAEAQANTKRSAEKMAAAAMLKKVSS